MARPHVCIESLPWLDRSVNPHAGPQRQSRVGYRNSRRSLRCHRGGVCSCTRRSRFSSRRLMHKASAWLTCAPQRVGEGTRRREANGGVGAPDADPRHRTGRPAQGQLARELSAAVSCSALCRDVQTRATLPHCPTNRLEENSPDLCETKGSGAVLFSQPQPSSQRPPAKRNAVPRAGNATTCGASPGCVTVRSCRCWCG